jgi:tetratricopeptide (TPR) repeat protein
MISILVSLTLFLGGQIPSRNDNTALREDAVAAYRKGQYLTAEDLIRRALDGTQALGNEYDNALSYSALGDILQAERKLADAEQSYRKAIYLLSHQRERIHEAAVVWRDLAADLTAEGRYHEALAALKEASNLVSEDKVEDPCLNAQILNNQGFIYYNERKMDKAETFFLRASAFQFTPGNPLDVDPWQILNNLGRLYQATQKNAKAEEFFTRSLQLAEARWGRAHPVLSVVLDNLGLLYIRSGRYQQAESHFQRSLEILEHSRVSFDAIFMVRTLYGLGETYHRQNDAPRAKEPLARAAGIAHGLGRLDEMPEAIEVLNAYARVLKELSQTAEAERLEAEAQKIRASLAYTVPLGNAN